MPAAPPLVSFDVTRPVGEQVAWLETEKPQYLLTYPSNLLAILRRCRKSGVTFPGLLGAATMGEVLEQDVRAACERDWGVSITDSYSAQEVGIIALQCPEYPHYHVQSENVMVEIIGPDGELLAPGEVGRVVVTDLHNFATPLIRYEVGDFAEFGGHCPCGRGLPVLGRILGRTRNMLTLPGGEQFWPSFPAEVFTDIAPVRQFQLIQRAAEKIEVMLVADEPLTATQEKRLREVLRKRLRHSFEMPFTYVDEISRAANGKYEDFRSELA